jgi:hypothetical protein
MHYDVAISELATLANRLFPTAGAIDEERQIGRGPVIADLAERLASGRDTLMIEPRQVGKTSALRAGVQVARRSSDVVVARADLKADGIYNSAQLGATLVETATEHGLSTGLLRERAKRLASGAGDALAAPVKALGAVADAFGVSAELTAVVGAVEQALERVGLTPFDQVLAALEGYAQISGRRTVVFLDEVQEVDEWKGEGTAVEKALVAAARRPHRQLRFVFAGSHDTALETLFAHGRPLHVLSDRCPLPPIAPDDWIAGLKDRFTEGGVECDDTVLTHLLGESRGHPLATVYLAKETFLAARYGGATAVEQVHVEDGLSRARLQLWWEEFTTS